MHLNDSSSITLHLKSHSLPKSKFRKIQIEDTAIIPHEIDKPPNSNPRSPKFKNKKKLELLELSLKIATMF